MSTLSKDFVIDLLQLGTGWEPSSIDFSPNDRKLTICLQPLDAFWEGQRCPKCKSTRIGPDDHGRKQVWRDLDAFNVRTLIECLIPRGKCESCGHVFTLKPVWQGITPYFTKAFEAFALGVMKETNVRSASRLLHESDQHLWRLLFDYVERTHDELSAAATEILHREWNKPEFRQGSAPIGRQRSPRTESPTYE